MKGGKKHGKERRLFRTALYRERNSCDYSRNRMGLRMITRFSEGKIVAGLIRLIFGFTIVWIIDLILMIVSKHIMRLLPV